MRFIKTKNITPHQKQELLALWNNEYPRDLQYENIRELDNYLNKLEDQNHILLMDDNHDIQGWYLDFIRDNERWFLVILNAELQGRRFGTKIIEMAKESNRELNGWIINSDKYLKANGKFYKSPILFYRKQNFQVLKDITLETEIKAIKIRWSKPQLK